MSPIIRPPPKPPDPPDGKGLKVKKTNIFKRFMAWLKSLI
jgi:hypothetical protein